MQVERTAQTDAAPAAPAGASGSRLGYDAFLKLLLAQLQHQDPLKPVDATTQISQLAELSGLDEQMKQNQRLDSLIASSAVMQALTVIGREVTGADGAAGRVVSATVEGDGVVVGLDNGGMLRLGDGSTVRP